MPASFDRVDAILAEWRREHPDTDPSPMGIIGRLHRIADVLAHEIETTLADFDLTRGEFDVLAALRRAGESCRLAPGQLIAQTHVTSGTMTNRVDRLAARGLVTRTTDPKDRRAVLVAITPAGLDLVDAALESLVTVERELLAGLGDDDTARLADDLRSLLQQD